jgi:hypothetical protein
MDFRVGGKVLLGVLTGAAALAAIASYNGFKGKLRASFVVSEYEAPPRAESLPDFNHAYPKKPTVIIKPVGFATGVLGAFLNGRVEYRGSNGVKQVTLVVPDAVYACVAREITGWKCQDGGSVITVGNLAPLESVPVQFWLPYMPHVTAYKDIRLTHSSGVGSIDFKTVDVPPGFIRSYAVPLIMATLLALSVLHTYFANRYVEQKLASLKRREAVDARKRNAEAGDAS